MKIFLILTIVFLSSLTLHAKEDNFIKDLEKKADAKQDRDKFYAPYNPKLSSYYIFRGAETDLLVCAYTDWGSAPALGCVSKISIEKDKLELEVLQLQKEKLEKELKKKK